MHTSRSPPAVDILWANKTSLWLDRNSAWKIDCFPGQSSPGSNRELCVPSPGHQCKLLPQRTHEQKHVTWGSSVNTTNDFEEDLCHQDGKSPNTCCETMTTLILVINNNNIINIDNNNVNMQSLVHTDILPKFPSPQNVAEKWVWWVGWENENFSKGKVKKKESSYSWIATDCPAPGSFFLLSYMR